MQITILIVLLCLLIFLIPKNYLKVYMCVCLFFLVASMFLLWPDNSFDLYRYYYLLDKYKQLSFLQVLGVEPFNLGASYPDLAVQYYVATYKVYSVFAWFISKIGMYQFLGVITCFIVYGLMFFRIKKMSDTLSAHRMTIISAVIFTLFTFDYIHLSLVRQCITYILFGYAVYAELVERKNKMQCFVIYILICFVHATGVMLLGFRLLIVLYKKIGKFPILVGILGIYAIVPYVQNILEWCNIYFLQVFLSKIVYYLTERGNAATQHASYKAICLYLLYSFIILYFRKYARQAVRYKDYTMFILFILAFCIPASRQQDIFERFQIIFPILMLPVIMELLEEFFGKNIFTIKMKKGYFQAYMGLCLLALGIGITVSAFAVNCHKSYRFAQPYFSFHNFMDNGDMSLSFIWSDS